MRKIADSIRSNARLFCILIFIIRLNFVKRNSQQLISSGHIKPSKRTYDYYNESLREITNDKIIFIRGLKGKGNNIIVILPKQNFIHELLRFSPPPFSRMNYTEMNSPRKR